MERGHLGEFVVERELGPTVHLARHPRRPDSPLALKVLAPAFANLPSAVSRFVGDGRVLSNLRSDHLATVHDVGAHGGRPFVVREFLDGPDVGEISRLCGPLAVLRVADLGMQAAEGLARAHAVGRLHQNLKPANLLVVPRFDGADLVKVCDFGGPTPAERAKVAPTEALIWAAPEQLRGEPIGPETDVYSLAAVLVMLLTGQRPPADPTRRSTAGWLAEVLRPELIGGIGAVLAQGLASDRRERIPDAGTLARELSPYAQRTAEAAGRQATVVLNAPLSLPPPVVEAWDSSPGTDPFAEPARLRANPEAPTDPPPISRGGREATQPAAEIGAIPAQETVVRMPQPPPVGADVLTMAPQKASTGALSLDDLEVPVPRRRFSLARVLLGLMLLAGVGAGAATAALGPDTWTSADGVGAFLGDSAQRSRDVLQALLTPRPVPPEPTPAPPPPAVVPPDAAAVDGPGDAGEAPDAGEGPDAGAAPDAGEGAAPGPATRP